jgi:two-component system sensor histidine kinase VicK
MEPGVPFALLGAVQLLLVTSLGGLAAVAVVRRTGAGLLVLVACAVLVAVEVRTALRLGYASSDDLALARAAAAAGLAIGLYGGALGRRAPATTPLLGVVVPLAAASGPALFSAGAFACAAVAAVARSRDAVGMWLAGGFGLWAVAAGVSSWADTGSAGPWWVLSLRAAGALAVLVALGFLAQASLLSKVVGAILLGVVAMAVAAVGVVGNVVVSSYDAQTRDTVNDAAQGRHASIVDLQQQVASTAHLASQVCHPDNANSLTLQDLRVQCQGFLEQILVNGDHDFVVRFRQGRAPESFAGRPALTASEVLGLASSPLVKAVLNGRGASRVDQVGDLTRLTGQSPRIALIGVGANESLRPRPTDPPTEVILYGVRIDDDYAARDPDADGGFRLSFLAGDPLQVVASNGSAKEQQQLLRIVRSSGAAKGVPPDGVTIGSQGANPTVALRPLTSVTPRRTVALLAMTRDPGPGLKTERDALRLLLVTALVALLAVAVVAVALGRRTVDPVRRLTLAAERVAAGDLCSTVGITARDEVGTLSRTFDGMTLSLGKLTGDLRETAGRLQTVLASMTDGLLATDGEGVVTSVNPAALQMLGLEEPDVLGEQLRVVADVRDASGQPLIDGRPILLDEQGEVVRPDGGTVPVRVVLTPLQDAEGRVLVLRDMTREREVERMKTEFLSNVSHELRTPLTPIRGYAEILVNKPGLPQEKVTSFATTIRDESLKMNRVVDLLVDVASIEAGRVHLDAREVAVKDLLEARVKHWEQRAGGRALKTRVARGLPKVLIDATWVAKALDELIDNSVKHTPPGTPITLVGSLSPEGDRVRIAVRDTGPGISQADQARLFTSFEQVDGSATRRVGGMGLGLSFVGRLAEDTGMPLTWTSTPGKGSEFALDLPTR